MSACPIDAIPLALVIPFAGVAFAFGVLVFIQAPSRMDELKTRIRGQVGADPSTGVPFRPTKAQQLIIDFDASRRLRRLPLWLTLTAILLLAYLVAEVVPSPFDGRTYACLVTIGSVLTLLPPAWVILLGASVLVKLRGLSE